MQRPRSRFPSFALSLGLLSPLALASGGDTGAAARDPAAVARWQAHSDAAELELLAGDAGITDPAKLARRAEVRAALAEYRRRADFGCPEVDDGTRAFGFVDAGGRRCAMAMLFDRFGGSHLTDRIARDGNGAMIIDLAGDPEVAAWVERLGIIVEEAARIQGPMIGAPPDVAPPQAGTPGVSRPYGGGGDGSSGGPGNGGPGAGGPVTGGTSSGGPGAGGPTARGVGSMTGGALGDEQLPDWLLWWEYNKLDFLLRPRALPLEQRASSSKLGLAIDGLDRPALLALLREQIAAPDAGLRASGAIAYGRIAGPDAHAELRGLLNDPQELVRHAALLGLGMAGDTRAVALLLDVARDGTIGSERVSAHGDEVAIVALGLARRRGQSPELDRAVASLASESPRYAAMLYPVLAASATDGAVRGFEGAVHEALAASDLPVAVRARALESLAIVDADDAASALSHALGARARELRPSAAMALAETGHPLAYAALATASEVEAHVATRGVLLVNLGRLGERAQDFLAKELVRGKRATAPFAALGLGIALREHDTPAHRHALREAARSAKSDETRGAYLLALGLARDAGAVDLLGDALSGSGNALTRSYAAQALGMIGTDDAHARLVAAARTERQAIACVGLAHGIAQFQRAYDAPVLASLLERVDDPSLANQIAPALVFHDTPEAYELAVALATDREQPRATRAAAVEAVGQLADARPRFAVAQLARQANHELFPPWLEQLWAFGL